MLLIVCILLTYLAAQILEINRKNRSYHSEKLKTCASQSCFDDLLFQPDAELFFLAINALSICVSEREIDNKLFQW